MICPPLPRNATLLAVILAAGAIASVPRLALALDVEPNNDTSTAEPVGGWVFGRGMLDDSSDAIDVFSLSATGDATFTARLSDYNTHENEFSVELWDASETVIAIGADDGRGGLALSYAIDDGADYYLVVQTALGSGAYHLWTSTDMDAPTLTALSSSDPAAGDSLTIAGTGFGTDASRVYVRVGQVDAPIMSITDTSITVTVPELSVDGDVFVSTGREYSNALSITIGGGTAGPPAGLDYTAPDSASLVHKGPGRIFFDRIVVSFTGSTSDTAAGAVLDAAVTAITPLASWTKVGFSPGTNTWQVQLNWDASATISDWDDLFEYLVANASVDDAMAEMPVDTNAAGVGPGQDVATSWTGVQSVYAAYDMIAIEEAWRLFASTSATLVPHSPDVVLIDSGLLPASPVGAVTRSSVDSAHFGMWGEPSTAGAWTQLDEASWFDGIESCAGTSHGTGMAAIIGANNGSEPRWDEGADRGGATIGMNGILSGLQQWGVDDDIDGEVDEAGESIGYNVNLFGIYSVNGGTSDDCTMNSFALTTAFDFMAARKWQPDVLSLSLSFEPVGTGQISDDAAANMSSAVLAVVAAGNTDAPGVTAYRNGLAEQVDRVLSGLVVGSTNPNPSATTADTRAVWPGDSGTKYSARSGPGREIDVVAPARVMSVKATSPTVATFGLTLGTSNSAAMVSGVAAMLKAADPTLDAHDLANIIQGTATPISNLWLPPEEMVRLDATAALAFVLGRAGALDQNVRVYAADYSNSRIWFQSYDLATRQFDGTASAFDATGVCQPVDVAVDPRGDLIYALCRNGSSPASLLVLAHGVIGELAKVDQYVLPGAVDLSTELVTTPEGYIVVATDASSGGGAASYTVLDSFDGSVLAVDEPLFPDSVVELEGAAASTTGQQVYFTANDNDGTVGGDQLGIIDLDAYFRAAGALTVTSADYASAFNPVQVRDVDFDPVDELPISLFFDSISDSELVWNDVDGSFVADDEVDYIDNGFTLC